MMGKLSETTKTMCVFLTSENEQTMSLIRENSEQEEMHTIQQQSILRVSFTTQQMGASIYDFTEAVLNEMALLLAQYSGLSLYLSSILRFAGGKKFLLICCNSFEYSPRHTE